MRPGPESSLLHTRDFCSDSTPLQGGVCPDPACFSCCGSCYGVSGASSLCEPHGRGGLTAESWATWPTAERGREMAPTFRRSVIFVTVTKMKTRPLAASDFRFCFKNLRGWWGRSKLTGTRTRHPDGIDAFSVYMHLCQFTGFFFGILRIIIRLR